MNSRARKQSHLSLCATEEVGFRSKTTLFEEIELIHCALPELDLNDIDTSISFVDRHLAAPLLIGAMTGGTGDDASFNSVLAAAAARFNVGLCLGSMRPALQNPSLCREFEVRETAPDILILSNIGGNQIIEYGPTRLLELSRQIGADGLIVHLNAGMELIQPGGNAEFRGILDGIRKLVDAAADYPVIVKETGMGLSLRDGKQLRDAGVRIVETGGAGGTSWIGVETLRATGRDARIGETLWDFGIPTAVTTAWMVETGFQVISSGGISSCLDIARALSLGAGMTAIARPILKAFAASGQQGIEDLLETLVTGLRYTMLCCGARTVNDLSKIPKTLGTRLQHHIRSEKPHS